MVMTDDDDGIVGNGLPIIETSNAQLIGDEDSGPRIRRDVIEADTNSSQSDRFGFSRGLSKGKMRLRSARGKVMKMGKKLKAFKRRLLKLNSRLINRLMKKAGIYFLLLLFFLLLKGCDSVK